MSSPVDKTPTKSEQSKQIMESAFRRIAESNEKLTKALVQQDAMGDEINVQKMSNDDTLKTLREQFEAVFKDDEDQPVTVSEVHDQDDLQPSQLLGGLPLKEAVLSDSVEDEDSPSVERHAKTASSSTESEQWVPPSFEPFVTGRPIVYVEE